MKKLTALLFVLLSQTVTAQTYQEKVDASKALLGQPVQEHEFYTLDKQPIAFAKLQGQPAVVYFFASWCAPCYATLENLYVARKSKEPEVNVIAVSLDDDWQKLAQMLKKTGYSGEVWKTSSRKAVLRNRMFANYASSLPYSIKIDEHGTLVEHNYDIKTVEQWAAVLGNAVSLTDAHHL